MKNDRQLTFKESGKTIIPYTSLPAKHTRCLKHEFIQKRDVFGHLFLQCKKCWSLRT